MSENNPLIGQKFGQLSVISKGDSYRWVNPKTGKVSVRSRWICLCDCGKEMLAPTNKLTGGKITHCQGCGYAKRPQSTRRQTAIERVFNNHVVRRAAKAGIEVQITLIEYESIINNSCHYCGTPPKDYNVYKNKFSKSEFIKFNGVDRVNSDGHYTLDNCVACCKICNSMKATLPLETFLNHIKNIFIYQESKK